MQNTDLLINELVAAERLGVNPQTLRVWRCQKKHIKYVKIGRLVRYRQSAVEAFIANRAVEVA